MITAKQALNNPKLLEKHKDKLKNIDIRNWAEVIVKYPEYFEELLNNLDGYDIFLLLYTCPEGVDNLPKEKINGLSGWELAQLIYRRPQLFNKFTEEQINKMRGADISSILAGAPQLFDKFTEEQIDRMRGQSISHILQNQPQLFDRFTKDQLSRLRESNIYYLIKAFSQFSLLFNKEKEGLAEDFEEAKMYVKCLLDPKHYAELNEGEKEIVKNQIIKEKR